MASEEIVKILGGAQNVEKASKPRGRFVSGIGGKVSAGKKGVTKGRMVGPGKAPIGSIYEGHVKFKTRAVSKLSERLEYPKDGLMSILNVKGRTAQRREKEGTLSEEESDRLYRIARVTQRAEQVFGSEQKAHEWLKSENSAFRGVAPIELLGTDAGAEAVTDELGRIEFGDLY